MVAIACTLVGSATLLINAVWVTGHAVTHFIRLQPTDTEDVRHILLELIEVVEVVLVAMVLYFITFGLYTLFLDRTLPVPRWMAAHSLDELTDKLFDIVGASLGVLFLAEVVEWDGERDLLRLGVGAAAVMLALAVSRLAGYTPGRRR